MSPSSTSEARKRREGDPDPIPLPGYILTTAGEIHKRALTGTQSEWRWLADIPSGAAKVDALDDLGWTSLPPPETFADDLVIARRPRMVTVELPADVRDRVADWPANGAHTPTCAVIHACRASRDAEQ